jgi:hypothetical protein
LLTSGGTISYVGRDYLLNAMYVGRQSRCSVEKLTRIGSRQFFQEAQIGPSSPLDLATHYGTRARADNTASASSTASVVSSCCVERVLYCCLLSYLRHQ